MKYLIIASSILLIAIKSFSQVNTLGHEKSNIEIDGSADTLVVPDMIYLKIEIDERMDGKTKISIPQTLW